ncbi:MAG: NADH:ubiquinone reductase (Na(+)-transporting) subunit F [Parabacteroides sp.]|nr:NADH:ubiquinone reductase (Na(+)-transporting) subunit F [Parabacteroides sp.]
MVLLMSGELTMIAGAVVFLLMTLILVIAILFAKAKLVPSGNVKLIVNGKKEIETPMGGTLLNALQGGGIFLSSACGGGGKCGQCRAQVLDGGGEILPTEKGFFNRKQIKDHWRLACQTKVKENMAIQIPDSVFGVKEWECEVISNKNVATFIKEFIVALPKGEHMDFVPGSYAQIKIPAFSMDYNKDIDKELIGDGYLPAWNKFGIFTLKCKNTEPTIRAYSMANYPAEGDRIMLTVRIATPPFKPKPQVGFQDVMPGIASSYIFTLKPGDKVMMSGPYGDFHPIFDSKREMMWIGGGAGMAPLRAQIMHMTKTLNTRDRKLSYFYGARALNEVFYLKDFLELEKEFPNFTFHLALDRPDPAADAAGVKYTAGFVHQVIYNNYLKDHDAPEDIEYYMCGPGPMSKAVEGMLDNLGVAPEMLHFDNFGG